MRLVLVIVATVRSAVRSTIRLGVQPTFPRKSPKHHDLVIAIAGFFVGGGFAVAGLGAFALGHPTFPHLHHAFAHFGGGAAFAAHLAHALFHHLHHAFAHFGGGAAFATHLAHALFHHLHHAFAHFVAVIRATGGASCGAST